VTLAEVGPEHAKSIVIGQQCQDISRFSEYAIVKAGGPRNSDRCADDSGYLPRVFCGFSHQNMAWGQQVSNVKWVEK